jgi:hypothetical protein
MTWPHPGYLPNRHLYPMISLVRQLAENYGPFLPESLHAELNDYLVDLYSVDHDRWADSPVLYRRIAAKIETRILAGEWADQEPLPTRDLAREYGVSEDSLRKAYRKLWDHELVVPLGHQPRWCVAHEDPLSCTWPRRNAHTHL